MTTVAWAVPLALALVALVPLVMTALRVVDEANRLRASARLLGELRPAVIELRRDAVAIRDAVQRLPHR